MGPRHLDHCLGSSTGPGAVGALPKDAPLPASPSPEGQGFLVLRASLQVAGAELRWCMVAGPSPKGTCEGGSLPWAAVPTEDPAAAPSTGCTLWASLWTDR